MKTFLKTLLAFILATTFLLTGCEKDEWQTVSCDIPVYEGNVFRDGEKLTYGESRNIDGTQSISFKLPTGYYQTENTGDYENDCKHGTGTYKYTNGDVYEGEFVNDVRQGEGTYMWKNGEYYIGEFQNNMMHGQGVYFWPSGRTYEGNFYENKMVWDD